MCSPPEPPRDAQLCGLNQTCPPSTASRGLWPVCNDSIPGEPPVVLISEWECLITKRLESDVKI